MHSRNVNLSQPSFLYNSANLVVEKLNFAQRSAPPYTKYGASQEHEAYFSSYVVYRFWLLAFLSSFT